jgi:peroxiredoxin
LKQPAQEMPRRLQLGDAAPDATVNDTQDKEYGLSRLWEQGPAVLVFLRHFG